MVLTVDSLPLTSLTIFLQDKLLTHRDLYEALQHAGVRISPNDCKRITASVGSDGISMGQLLRILGGNVQLPTAAEAHAFHQAQLRAAALAAATTGLPAPLPAQHPSSTSRGSAGGAARRDPHHRFDGALPNSKPRSYRSPVGGNDHMQANLSTSEGEFFYVPLHITRIVLTV